MSDYPPASTLLARLRRTGHRKRKSLGQHFLTDQAVLNRIAAAVGADSRTLVVEIGAGPATLTTLLAARAGGVLAVEPDQRLIAFHEQIFDRDDRVEIVYEDALRIDLWALALEKKAKWGLERAVLAGNIPFKISSPLLFGQLGPHQPWSRLVLMIQKEVADRIMARPGARDYSILSVKLAYWWKAAKRFEIPAEKFTPRPRVNASLIVLEPTDPDVRPSEAVWPGLSKMIDKSFNQRRKKLYNSLDRTWNRSPGREKIREALTDLGVDPDARAQNLTPDNFAGLYSRLIKIKRP
ncbi:ribosomal RNA small subunit methyltransferase A, partial [Candidatus Sumerlaeota bacterium]|nr:ribosomal RNA small subunit methyltransferase A [Candidatus Sumerlaeota bacterium]